MFSITPSAHYTLLHSFAGSDGAALSTLLLASDGNFYGTTTSQGSNHGGTLSESPPAAPSLRSTTFARLAPAMTVAARFGGLAQGTDGYLYGTTTSGGTGFLYGTVFKITLNGVLTTLHSFLSSDGSSPQGKLVQASDGNFYGTTTSGGNTQACTFGCGTVFKITANGTFTPLHNFDGTDGSFVLAGLIQASDGKLYGTAGRGGNAQNRTTCGTIFDITLGGTLTTLHNFCGFPTEGSLPVGGLMQASNGIFYGITEAAEARVMARSSAW